MITAIQYNIYSLHMLKYLRYVACVYQKLEVLLMIKQAVKRPWLSWHYKVLIAACFLIGAVIFVLAYVGMVQFSGLGLLNDPILYWLSTHRDPILTNIMLAVTSAANPTFFILSISVIAIAWMYKKREVWRPFLMLVAVSATAVAAVLIKSITQNPRPLKIDMVPPFELDFSFPSNHTACTFIFLLVSGYLFYSRYKASDKHFWLIVWIMTTLSGTIIIAISRLYLGYHWLTDVVGAIGLGLIIFGIIVLVDRHVINRWPDKKNND